MKNGYFEVGDIIKGTPAANRPYEITNAYMLEAVVTFVKTNSNSMTVEVTKHKYREEVGNTYAVENNTKYFALVEEKEKDFWESLEVL